MPAEQARGSLRQVWLAVHRLLGLGTGVLFIIATLTGAVLVYEDELEHRLNGSPYIVTPGDVGAEAVLASVMRQIPGELVEFRWPSDGEPYYTAEMRYADGSRGTAHMDPGSGELAQPAGRRSDLIGIIRGVHTTLLAGRAGRLLVMIGAVSALFGLVSGVILRRPAYAGAGHESDTPGDAVVPRTLRLHRPAGAVAGAFLIVITLTGVLSAFRAPRPYRVLDTTRMHAQANEPGSGVAPRTGVQTLLKSAMQSVPGGSPRRLLMPIRPGENVRVVMQDGAGGRSGRTKVVEIDPRSAAVVGPRSGVARVRNGGSLVAFNTAIHTGAFKGAWVKPVYVMLCITGAGLAATGSAGWWSRSREEARRVNLRGRANSDAGSTEPGQRETNLEMRASSRGGV